MALLGESPNEFMSQGKNREVGFSSHAESDGGFPTSSHLAESQWGWQVFKPTEWRRWVCVLSQLVP